MGFFSQDCHGCGHPALSMYSGTTELNRWMTEVIVFSPDGDIHKGEYDGYGRVAGAEYAVGEANTVWHVACWEVAGRPMKYLGESRRSGDQGFFFEPGDHALPDPRIKGQPHPYHGSMHRHSILGDR